MRTLAKVLIGLAGLGFVLAVAGAFAGRIMHVAPEGYSRACSNLALLAIALVLTFDTPEQRIPRLGDERR